MDLKTYLNKWQIRVGDAADQLGMHYSYISAIANRGRYPSRKIAYRIFKWSGGEVTLEELLDPENYDLYKGQPPVNV